MNKSHSKFKLWFDRFLSKSLWKQFALVFAFLVGALGVSYILLPIWSDNWQRVCEENNISSWLLPIYLLIDSNALNNIYLDDANVYRYAEFLKEFSKDTQFIVITHRKGTMEAANTVYGITMEEKGISKLLSMNLKA